MRVRWIVASALSIVLGAVTALVMYGSSAQAADDDYTVRIVNHTGEKVWVGSVAESGSQQITGLPALEDGQDATVKIPVNGDGKWFGKFVPRQKCDGADGSFHCKVADCGPQIDRCTKYTPDPASYAEFHFDRNNSMGQWYNASYVDGFSVPVTVDANMDNPPDSGECSQAGCPDDLMPHCPDGNVVKDPDTGDPLVCKNPDPDSPDTEYSKTMSEHCPKAYSWSGNDTVPGNDVVRNCSKCSGFTVTFH